MADLPRAIVEIRIVDKASQTEIVANTAALTVKDLKASSAEVIAHIAVVLTDQIKELPNG